MSKYHWFLKAQFQNTNLKKKIFDETGRYNIWCDDRCTIQGSHMKIVDIMYCTQACVWSKDDYIYHN